MKSIVDSQGTQATQTLPGTWPTYTLIGGREESFYQLGVRDSKNYRPLMDHIEQLFKSPSWALNKGLSAFTHLQALKLSMRKTPYSLDLMAYSEGLGLAYPKLLAAYLLPEMVSAIDQWIPETSQIVGRILKNIGLHPFPKSPLGCSSFFYWDEQKKAPVHGRILDFSLVGDFDAQERAVHYKFPHAPQVWSLSSAGLALPCLTSMNSDGLTVALHQKFNSHFSWEGTSIFEIISTLLWEGHNKKAVQKILKNSRTFTCWGLYMSFPNGDVMEVDLEQDKCIIREFTLKEKDVLYFNNFPIGQKPPCSPHGMVVHNQMRVNTALRKIERTQSELQSQKRKMNEEDFLKMIGTPLLQKGRTPKEWNSDVITPGTLHVVSMDAVHGEVHGIPGPAPKVLVDQKLVFEGPLWAKTGKSTEFSQATLKSMKKTKATPMEQAPGYQKDLENYASGQAHVGMAISALDLDDLPGAFHHMQMGLSYFEGFPEEVIYRFYFFVMQYIHVHERPEMMLLLKDFREIAPLLPPFLSEHAYLFIFRLEKILLGRSDIAEEHFRHPALLRAFTFEKKLKRFFMKRLRAYIIPRPDLMDVLYLYVK